MSVRAENTDLSFEIMFREKGQQPNGAVAERH